MKIKKTVILLSVLMLFLLIAGVSANDINTTDQLSIDENIDVESSTVDHEVISEDSDKGTFTDLNNLIENSDTEIKLEKDYSYNNNTDFNFINGIYIKKSINIDGKGHTIDGKNSACIFDIWRDSEVIFKNIHFINAGRDGNDGGAINSDSFETNISVINCYFVNNIASSGGAICGLDISIINSTFTNNSANNNGGAIYSLQNLVVNNCQFINNNANRIGGSIFSNVKLKVYNSKFINSTNFHYYCEEEVININNTFSHDDYTELFVNASKDYGIVNLNKNWTATQTILINGNNVVVNGNGYTIDALNKCRIFHVTGKNVTIKNINLKNAYSETFDGSAIYSKYDSNIKVSNSNFTNNHAFDGGAICGYDIEIVNSNFINNTAEYYGGAIDANNLSVINSNFIDNYALELGGAINLGYDVNSKNALISDSTFINNIANDIGGAIYFGNYMHKNLTIQNSKFINNTNFHVNSYNDFIDINNTFSHDDYTDLFVNASKDYGIVNLNKNWIATQTILIKGNDVVVNGNGYTIDALNKCRIFHVTGKNVTIKNINLQNGYSYKGGAIYSDGNISIINSSFNNNHAIAFGGAIETEGIYLSNSNFTNNIADFKGGAIYMWGNNSIINSNFINNSAIVGGAVQGGGINTIIDKSNFINNNASTCGGAVSIWSGSMSVTYSTFINNTANTDGGAIEYTGDDDDVTTSILNSSFIQNRANGNGGAIEYRWGAKGNIVNSTFKQNIDQKGDAVYYDDICNITITGSHFINNTKLVNKHDEPIISNSTSNNNVDNSKSTTTTVTTKKATKITAKKKTFKAKTKTKKYTITLKAGKNAVKKVRVYLKIKGKTYKATTNNKGKATFKIKLKKKGTFNTKITFNGNKSYKASSKTIKIKIK